MLASVVLFWIISRLWRLQGSSFRPLDSWKYWSNRFGSCSSCSLFFTVEIQVYCIFVIKLSKILIYGNVFYVMQYQKILEKFVHEWKYSNYCRFLYGLNDRLESKISKIAQEIYGSSGLDIHPKAKEKLNLYEKQGFGHLPVCMAKTHLSLSHDPSLTGAPRGKLLSLKINIHKFMINSL